MSIEPARDAEERVRLLWSAELDDDSKPSSQGMRKLEAAEPPQVLMQRAGPRRGCDTQKMVCRGALVPKSGLERPHGKERVHRTPPGRTVRRPDLDWGGRQSPRAL